MEHLLRAATYNLRYANTKDTGNLWVDRAPVVINLIRFHDFDILATQEGLGAPLDHIAHALPYYDRYGIARDDGKDQGEHCAIFFKKDRFDFIRGGDFWLSETPDRPGFGWDAKHNRLCSWIELADRETASNLFVFNVHFDHYGETARLNSSRLVLNRIRTIAGENAVILAGDFNCDRDAPEYQAIARSQIVTDAMSLSDHPYLNSPSFNSWGQESAENRFIDHIFVTSHFSVRRFGVLTDTYYMKTPSDHFPVMADLVRK